MTEAEREICKIFLEDLADLNKSHSYNEYKMLMGILDAEPCEDAISRQAAIDVLCSTCIVNTPETCSTIQKGDNWCEEVYMLKNLPPAQPETCEGCKHLDKWENEVEYGYPSPCTCCKRRVEDHYE